MSKTPPEAKHNRAQPFSFKRKEWPDEGNQLKVKLEGKKGGVPLTNICQGLGWFRTPKVVLTVDSRV